MNDIKSYGKWKLNFYYLVIELILCECITLTIQQNDQCFRAAVLDHVRQIYKPNVTDVIRNMNLNFQVYVDAALLARENYVDLLVYPESGLIFPVTTRQQALKYSTIIPNNYGQVLCKNRTAFPNDMIDNTDDLLEGLSCLSLIGEMYLVANLLDRQPCQHGIDKSCPTDGNYVFNTAVMFGRQGELLAKYHKMHPFGEMQLNHPPKDDLVMVKTDDIGRLGFQICFDIIYSKPGHQMATDRVYDVDTIIMPTEWFDEAPLLSATQIQMAWAFRNRVNLLASNIHAPQFGTVGSGIYAGDQSHHFLAADFYNQTGVERLIITNLPIKPRKEHAFCDVSQSRIVRVPLNDMHERSVQHLYIQMNSTNVTLVSLDVDHSDGLISEHNGVKCYLVYKANFTALKDGKYFLLASNRTRPNPSYRWAEEFCALTYCQVSKSGECHLYSSVDIALFGYVKLTGVFSKQSFVYPSSVGYQHRPTETINRKWNYWKEPDSVNTYTIQFGNDNQTEPSETLATLALYGRPYERDPPYKQVPV